MLAALMLGSLRIFQKFLPRIPFTLYPKANFNYKSDKSDIVGFLFVLQEILGKEYRYLSQNFTKWLKFKKNPCITGSPYLYIMCL